MTEKYTIDSPITGYVPASDGWLDVLTGHGATPSAQGIVTAYNLWCLKYDLDPNLAIAQGCQEAAYFTSARWTEESNPSGLGVTADNTPPNPFKSPQEGIQAHCEHLCCYVYDIGDCPVDHGHMADRRHTFHDGMPRVRDLVRLPQRAWANPGTNYAAAIVAIANSVPDGAQPEAPVTDIDSLGIIDIRDRMAKAPGQGAGYKHAKDGIIVHYNGPPTHDPALARFISDANFHIGPYLNEYTIAYIYGIGDEPDDGGDAPIYLMRDPDDVCWHCGSWPENATYTPIAFTFGEGQSAGPGQLRSLRKLADALRARDGFGRESVKGHQEVDSTACPGTLMDDFIYPYRAGKDGPVSDYIVFKETGHGVAGGFKQFFLHNGGVPIFGYPITEEIQEGGLTVQYFERNRFEYHPENKAPNDVQLTRYGAAAAAAAGHSGPGIP